MKPLIHSAIGLALSSFALGATVSLPFQTNFDSGVTVGTDGTFIPGGTSTTQPALFDLGGGNLSLRLVSNNANSSATVQNSTLAGTGFVISATFTITTLNGSGDANVALGVLGNNTNFNATSANNRYYLSYSLTNGGLSIQNNGGTTGLTSPTSGGSFSSVPSQGSQVTLTLTGTYNSDGTLNLSGSATSGSQTINAGSTTTVAANTYSGSNFGVRSGTNSTRNATLDFTSFSLQAIPEPSSVALLGIFGGLATLRRKRN